MPEFVAMERTVVEQRDEEFIPLGVRQLCFSGTHEAGGALLYSLGPADAVTIVDLLAFCGYLERGGGFGGIGAEFRFGHFNVRPTLMN